MKKNNADEKKLGCMALAESQKSPELAPSTTKTELQERLKHLVGAAAIAKESTSA